MIRTETKHARWRIRAEFRFIWESCDGERYTRKYG